MRKFKVLFTTLIFSCATLLFADSPLPKTPKPKKSSNNKEAVIFVRDNSGKLTTGNINTFSDMLSAKLSNDGLSIMDWKDVVQKFSESSYTDNEIYGMAKQFMAVATNTGTNRSISMNSSASIKKDDSGMVKKTKHGSNAQASVLRIGQMLNANYIIVASLGTIGHEKRIFKGEGTIYKTNNTADIYSLPIILKILDGNTGQSLLGTTVTAYDKILQNANLKVETDNVLNNLLETGTTKISENVEKEIGSISDVKLNKSVANFTVACNVDGATVALDGAVIGSTPGNFAAKPGIHQLRLTRQYFQPWENTVNIFPGQKININLEFTEEGQQKYKDLASFKQDQELNKETTDAEIDIAKQQSKADADAKEKISSGQETYLKNSYIRSDGFAEQLTRIIHGRF